MNQKQIWVVTGGIILLAFLLIFGKTVNPNKEKEAKVANNTTEKVETFNFEKVLESSKSNFDSVRKIKIKTLETAINTASEPNKIIAYNNLAKYWKDSLGIMEPYLFYTAKAANLDNSEKTLTFAAQQLVDNLLELHEPSVQNWLATQAKVLLDKALLINPNNDSNKISLGACYLFGNISNQPMQEIGKLKEIERKNPNNLYVHYILGLGGIKSNQLGKAVEHFKVLATAQPSNVIYTLHLAEVYDQMKDKANAVEYYNKTKALVKDDRISKEIDKRIEELK